MGGGANYVASRVGKREKANGIIFDIVQMDFQMALEYINT